VESFSEDVASDLWQIREVAVAELVQQKLMFAV
jgi:hypothetical protein